MTQSHSKEVLSLENTEERVLCWPTGQTNTVFLHVGQYTACRCHSRWSPTHRPGLPEAGRVAAGPDPMEMSLGCVAMTASGLSVIM